MSFPLPRPESSQLPQCLVRNIDCQQKAIRAVRFNADGNYMLSCGSDKSLKLWSVRQGTHLKTYSGHGYEVLDADSSYDNSQICSCSSDKTVILWDVATGQVASKLRGHAGKVNCIQFNEEATVILSGSIDGTVRCWDTRSRNFKPIQVLDDARDGISSLNVVQHEVLTGSVDGKVRCYDLRMGQLRVDSINSPITCVCFSQDSHCTLSSSLDSTVRLLDKTTGDMLGECVLQLDTPEGSLSYSQASAPNHEGLQIQTKQLLLTKRYRGHKMKGYKLDCCFSSKDDYVLSCSEDGFVYCWDLVEGSLSLKLHVGKGVVQSLSFHPTESCFLTAMEGHVQVWALEPLETG